MWEGDEDATAIEMAFSKKRVEDRKKWLREFVPGTYLDQSVKDIGYTDFVNKVWHAWHFNHSALSNSCSLFPDGDALVCTSAMFGASAPLLRQACTWLA